VSAAAVWSSLYCAGVLRSLHSFPTRRSSDLSSLHEGTSESGTILALELAHFEQFCQGLDPEAVLWTLNQLLADLEGVLDRHRAQVVTYLGGGFVALLREAAHAERAVEAALELRDTIAG